MSFRCYESATTDFWARHRCRHHRDGTAELHALIGAHTFISGRIKASGGDRVLDRLERADRYSLDLAERIKAPRVP